ncbi:hypothetical protein GOP47_0017968 [Adiantum capillus-veneris]|uniref:Uncharacterized protein n=1 Tax=Adiantum capillus-veneris TaxID=13818 RepID=A0A9D4UGM2_ADICA|nr:hypothetical protein GOP47_0017968 [Adiantum capillus-veneris]
MVFRAAEAKKVHIPDELEDVVDEEEDEEWKTWGKPKPKVPPPFDPPPDDLSTLSPLHIQEEMLKRHMGTAMGFVKLRLDVRRSKDEITSIAEKWTKLLRTGSISAKIMAVDVSTIMFIIEDGQSIAEVKDFILEQPEAYEFKLGQQAFRRPGDPPVETLVPHCDSQSAIALAKNRVFHSKSKHKEVRYHVVRDILASKRIELVKVHKDENPVDALTQRLASERFAHCIEMMGVG